MKVMLPRLLLNMILFSLLVGTLPLLFLGGVSYSWASHIIEDKVRQGNMQILKQIHSRVEQLARNVDNSVTQYMNSSLVNQAMNKPLQASDFQTVDQLLADLFYFQTFELGVQRVSIVNFRQHWLLSSGGVYSLEDGNIPPRVMSYIDSPLSSVWETEKYYDSDIPSKQGDNERVYYNVNLVKKVPINSPDPIGLVIAKIPLYELKKHSVQDAQLGGFFILDREYRVLVDSNSDQVGELWPHPTYIEAIRNSIIAESYFEEGDVGVNFTKSDYNGWIYVSVASLKEVTKESRQIGWLTIIVTLCSFVAIAVISYKGSQRMYRPIRRLHSLATGADTVNTRSGDDIESIGESIQSLHQLHTRMNTQLREQIPKLTYFFVLRLLQGEVSPVEIKEKLTDLKEAESWHAFYVVVARIDTLESTRYEEKDRKILTFAIANMVSELIPASNRLSPLITGGDTIVVIFGSPLSEANLIRNNLDELIWKIHKSVNFYLDLRISLGISNPYYGLPDTAKAYKEALKALKFRGLSNQLVTIYHEDIQNTASSDMSYPTEIEEQLLSAVRAGEREQILPLLKQFLDALTKPRMSLKEYELSLIRLLTQLTRIVQDEGKLSLVWDDGDVSLFNRLNELKNVKEIENWLYHSVLLPIVDYREGLREDHNKRITEQVIVTITNHYNQEITLEMCASALNYHPNHLGRIFRAYTGVTFSEYLHTYRMNLAKRWLLDSDMKISAIAKELGFYNSQNFIRSFRKAEGMTPGAYREENTKLD